MEQALSPILKRNFNKKKWRETQYSHKQRVTDWDNKRKLAIKRKYNKLLRKEEIQLFSRTRLENDPTSESNGGTGVQAEHRHPMRMSEMKRARLEFERTKTLKEEERKAREQEHKKVEEAREQEHENRDDAIKRSNQEKLDDGGTSVKTKFGRSLRMSEMQRARLEFERIKKIKEEEKKAREQKQKEREEAIKKSKQERLERIKKLTQKTKKGQPVMKGRIEILLDKIQKHASQGQ